MTPKRWPKRLIYAKESVSPEMHLFLLRDYLRSKKNEDLQKNSWVIENSCVHPHLEIKKITSSVTLNGISPHPLSTQKTFRGHQNHGIFATKKIEAGIEIGEYVGELYIANDKQSLQTLLMRIPSSEYMWVIEINSLFLIVDAQNIANELALINDYQRLRSKPNVKMQPLIHKGFFYFAYVTVCDIHEGEELLVDYGPMFWNAFQKKKKTLKQ